MAATAVYLWRPLTLTSKQERIQTKIMQKFYVEHSTAGITLSILAMLNFVQKMLQHNNALLATKVLV